MKTRHKCDALKDPHNMVCGYDQRDFYSTVMLMRRKMINFSKRKYLSRAKNTFDDLQRIHKKYACFSQVTIVETLKKFNVDIQVYFNGVIIGPHSMILAENGEKI